MPNSTLIYCCPVPGLEKYWDLLGNKGQGELFYDHRNNLFTFRKDHSFVAVSLKNNLPVSDRHFQLDIIEPILSLTYSRNRRYVAVQASNLPLKVFDIETGQELDIKFKHLEKTASIVMFEWLWDQHSTIDFFVLTTTAIFLFKADEKKTKLKQITYFPLEFHYSWFEPKSEVLLLANTSGLVQSVFFSTYPKTKKIKGPTFVLDLRPKTTGKNQSEDLNKSASPDLNLKHNAQTPSIAPPLRNRDIFQEYTGDSSNNKQKSQQHKVMFVSMYGAPTLVHMNVECGSIFLFSVTAKRVDIYQSSLTVPPNGKYNLTLVDNLIVVHSIDEGKSYIFDIKKSNPSKWIGQAIGIPRRSPKSLPFQHDQNNIMMTTSSIVTLLPLEMRRSRSAPNEEGIINGMNLNKKDFSDKKKDIEKAIRDEVIIYVNIDSNEEYKSQEEEEKKKHKHMTKIDEFDMEQSMALGSETFPSEKMSYLPETLPGTGMRFSDIEYHDEQAFKPVESMEMNSQVRTEPKDECLYSNSAKILDENYFIDPKNKILLGYEIDFKVASTMFHDNINAFFFLVRRTGCKELAIQFLKKVIVEKEEVMNLSFIFHKLLEIYRKVQEKRTLKEMQDLPSKKKRESIAGSPKNFLMEESMLSSKISSIDNQTALSAFSPYNVIIQTDLYIHILLPLTEDSDFDQGYLILVLLEYFRAAMENSVQVLDGIQAIFFKVIIMKKKFLLLYQLLQFHCLDDSLELAEVLIKLGTKDKSDFEGSPSNPLIRFIDTDYLPEAFQLGIDMLGRLQKTKKVVKYLLMVGKITDALEIATRKSFEGIDPRWFLDAAAKQASPKILNDLTQFFLKSVKKGKGSDSNTIASNMAEIVQTFKSQHNSPQKS